MVGVGQHIEVKVTRCGTVNYYSNTNNTTVLSCQINVTTAFKLQHDSACDSRYFIVKNRIYSSLWLTLTHSLTQKTEKLTDMNMRRVSISQCDK